MKPNDRNDKKGIVIGYYDGINTMFLNKDTFLRPLALAEYMDAECIFYYGYNKGVDPIPVEYNGAKLICLNEMRNNWRFSLKMAFVLLRNLKRCRALVHFHLTSNTFLLNFIYKLFNRRGVTWLTADMEMPLVRETVDTEFWTKGGGKRLVKAFLVNNLFRDLDIFSVETKESYACFEPLFRRKRWQCLVRTPCGISEREMSCVPVRDVSKKENILLTVGRLGSRQKNNEMLLEALAKVDLKGWKAYLIGPFTTTFDTRDGNDDFERYLKEYFIKYPHLKDKVVITGPIYNPKELFSYYAKAKIFVLTSRHEGFGNVIGQALWYRCHIMSTDVGGSKDMSDDWKYGTIINQEDSDDLAAKLTRLIDHEESISYPTVEFARSISYAEMMKNSIGPMIAGKL